MLQRLKTLYLELGTEVRWRESLHLRIAVACCFIGHGILAYQASTNFGSEWSSWVRSILPRDYEYSLSEIFLKIVATIDIVDGLLLFLPRIPRSALVWVFGWGAMTAASRLFFLGAYIPPFEINTLNAAAEFIKRGPNWIMPLFLIAITSPMLDKKLKILENKSKWLDFAVGSQILAIYLKNSYELNSPFFEFELLKIGMPTWFFWTITASSLLGFILVVISYKLPRFFNYVRILAFIVPMTYFSAEAFFVYNRNLPGGISFTLIRFVSHISMYLSMVLWTKMQLDMFRSGPMSKALPA